MGESDINGEPTEDELQAAFLAARAEGAILQDNVLKAIIRAVKGVNPDMSGARA
jgi:hypothetical protein